MKKQICALLFMLAITTTATMQPAFSLHAIDKPAYKNSFTHNALNLFNTADEQSKWGFMEKKFITDIYADKKMTLSHVTAAIPTAAAALAGYLLTTDASLLERSTKSNLILLGGGALAATMVSAQYLESYLTAQANRKAITNFFAHWDTYKFYVPAELLEYCTTIADVIKAQGLEETLQNAQIIVKDLQDMITRHFESRYKKLLEFEASNNLSDTKTVSEIFKNFIGGTKDLA